MNQQKGKKGQNRQSEKESKRIHFFACRLRKHPQSDHVLPLLQPLLYLNHNHSSVIATTHPPLLLDLGNLEFPRLLNPKVPSGSSVLEVESQVRPKMKRPLAGEDAKMKKLLRPNDLECEEDDATPPAGFAHLDENLLFEVLKHADARTLAMAACVSRLWHRTAQDERLWELICTRHWPNIGCGNQQLRSVVLALGGFKRLHSLYLPLSKQQQPGSASSSASASASAWAPPLPPMMGVKPPTRWGKDEVNLFLSLLSIRCYEKMNITSRGR